MSGRIDLATLDTSTRAQDGAPLELRHPATGKPMPGWTLKVRGYDSRAYLALLDEQQRRRLERLAARKTPTVDEMKAEALEAAATLVAGWPDTFDLDGQAFAYGEANVVRLFTRFPWIREQVEAFAANRENFLPGSASS